MLMGAAISSCCPTHLRPATYSSRLFENSTPAQRLLESKDESKKDGQVNVACLPNLGTMTQADHPIRGIKCILGVVLREKDEHIAEMFLQISRGNTRSLRHPSSGRTGAQRRTSGVRIRSNTNALNQIIRRRIEEIFSWDKATGYFRKSRHRGVEPTHATGQHAVAACNLVRMAKLSLGLTLLAEP
jgi:hypothetical protein